MTSSVRAELLEHILADGILHGTDERPIVSRDGSASPWMLDSLSVTLTPRGAELAARCMLELLERFDGRQLATYGLIGVPILQSCIVLGAGRYRGLLVRKEIKAHGSRRRIEGVIDPDEPVVIVDDSVSSGLSMGECCAHLEAAGLRVEGCVSLVRFGYERGFGEMLARGYRMESVFDLWTEVLPRVRGETALPRNPTRVFESVERSGSTFAEGLHPTRLAREAFLAYLRDAKVPRAPATLDRDYDASGGVFVSVRDRDEPTRRHVRDGFFRFADEPAEPVAEQVVMASIKAARTLATAPDPRATLERSAIAVTFLSSLEPVIVGELDNDRFGILVRSQERPFQMGGALPRMPGIASTWEQFEHARSHNARLAPFEPFEVFRYRVDKRVEPDATWTPGGVASARAPDWTRDRERAGAVADHALQIVRSLQASQSVPGHRFDCPNIPEGAIESLFVSVYLEGRMVGCMGGPVTDLDDAIRRFSTEAWNDRRFGIDERARPATLSVGVTLLYDAVELGALAPDDAAAEIRAGRHALMVHQGERIGMLLPFIAVTDDLDRRAFARETIDKAGITRPPYHWTRFEAASWFADANGTRPMEGALPVRPHRARTSLEAMATLLTGYLLRHQRADGSLILSYRPFHNEAVVGSDLLRLTSGSAVLARAANVLGREELRDAGRRAYQHVRAALGWPETVSIAALETTPPNTLAFALMHRCEAECDRSDDSEASVIASALWSRIDRHGAIPTPDADAAYADGRQDYEPGQTLLALSRAVERKRCDTDERALARAFRFYRHRYRFRHSWPQFSWQAQSAAAWFELRRDSTFADYVCEIVDAALPYQRPDSGDFFDGGGDDAPHVMSVVYLEGLAPALRVARARSDKDRMQRYEAAVDRALELLDRLLIQSEDAATLPNPAWALGGVRCSTMSGRVRTDFVQHALAAVLTLLENPTR